MEKFRTFLTEDFKTALKQHSRPAARRAKALGLEYYGFGRYGTKGSHVVSYVVKNNILVKVNPKLDEKKPDFGGPDYYKPSKIYNHYNNKYSEWGMVHPTSPEYSEKLFADKENLKSEDGKVFIEALKKRLDNFFTAATDDVDYYEKHLKDIQKKVENSTEDHDKKYWQSHLETNTTLLDQYKKRKKDITDLQDRLNSEFSDEFFASPKKEEEAPPKKGRGRPKTRHDHYAKHAEVSETEANSLTHDYIEKVLGTTDKKQMEVHEALSGVYVRDKFTYAETSAISHYTGAGSTSMILRAVKKREKPEEAKYDDYHQTSTDTAIKNLDAAIDAIPLPFNTTLFSGLKSPFMKASNFKVGELVHFSGYISTSLKWQTASNFAETERHLSPDQPNSTKMIVQINAKKGQSALYAGSNLSEHSSEYEMILPRDTVFKVTEPPKVLKNHSDIGYGDTDIVVIQLDIVDQV